MFLDSFDLGYVPRMRERRAEPRRRVMQDAELFISGDDITLPCFVLNISANGAGIKCDLIPRAGTKVRLTMRDGYSFDAVTAWYGRGQLGLRFTAPNDQ
ncbi:MAG TPA: PilZ domain-containing protein [Rhizomicrobium sp.]|jgi:hypothetical protein